MRLVNTSRIEVQARVPLAVAPLLHEGMEVTVRGPEGEVVSPIRALVPVGDERSRMFEVRVG